MGVADDLERIIELQDRLNGELQRTEDIVRNIGETTVAESQRVQQVQANNDRGFIPLLQQTFRAVTDRVLGRETITTSDSLQAGVITTSDNLFTGPTAGQRSTAGSINPGPRTRGTGRGRTQVDAGFGAVVYQQYDPFAAEQRTETNRTLGEIRDGIRRNNNSTRAAR